MNLNLAISNVKLHAPYISSFLNAFFFLKHALSQMATFSSI